MKKILLITVGLSISLLEAITTGTSFSRDNTTQIVTDTKTGLQWQDNEDAKTVEKTWIEAIKYCENLTLGGYDDWRLPNFNELYFLADKNKRSPAISPVFQNANYDVYWTSSTVIGSKYDSTVSGNEDSAWGIFFYNGSEYWNSKSIRHFVRCVRAGQ